MTKYTLTPNYPARMMSEAFCDHSAQFQEYGHLFGLTAERDTYGAAILANAAAQRKREIQLWFYNKCSSYFAKCSLLGYHSVEEQ